MITKQEFLTKIRTKYPSYQGVDDNILYNKIITKYPEYKAQVQEESVEIKQQPIQSTQQPIKVEASSLVKQSFAQPNALQALQDIKPQEKQQYQKRYFSDEQAIVDQMITDGYSEDVARQTIEKRREDYLKDTKLDTTEAQLLINMADAGLDMPRAVEGLKAFRSDELKKQWEEMPLAKKAGKTFFDFVVGTLSGGVGELGGITQFVTGGKSELGKAGMEAREYVREVAPGKATAAGEILGAGSIDYGLGVGLGKATGLGSKFAGLTPTKQLALGGAGYGALTQIGEKGEKATAEDIALGAGLGAGAGLALGKVVLPAVAKTVQKGMKYGSAGIKGGVKGLGKSVIRDVKRPLTKIQTEGIAPKLAYKQSTRANKFKKPDEKEFKIMTGESTGEFAVKRGMTKTGDDAIEEAVKFWNKSKKQADDALDLIDGQFSFKTKTGKDYMKIMLDDLTKKLNKTVADDANKFNLLKNKYNKTGKISLAESNLIKRRYAKAFKYPKDKVYSNAAQKSKNIQDGVRKKQFQIAKTQGLSNLDKINKTTQAWKFYADKLADNLAGKEVNRMFGITDFIALSGGEPTNVALFLGKKIGESGLIKRGIIKGFGKQTRPSMIEATRGSILQQNLGKRASKVKDILDVKGLLPQKAGKGAKQPIIAPLSDAQVIAESKLPLKKTKYGTNNRVSSDMTNRGLSSKSKLNKDIPKAISGKAGFIDPVVISDDLAKLGKKITNPAEINTIARSMVAKMNIAKEFVAKATQRVASYIRKYGSQLKDKLGEMFDDLADITGTRQKIIGGQRAKLADLGKRKTAIGLLEKGDDASKVFDKTGWYKGTDGKMRFEISDALAKIKEIPTSRVKKLSDVLEHDELFKQYPALKGVKLEFSKLPDNVSGYFMPNQRKIVLDSAFHTKFKPFKLTKEEQLTPYWLKGERAPKGGEYWKKSGFSNETELGKALLVDKNVKSTLLHELQHVIQGIEDFAKGGSAKLVVNNKIQELKSIASTLRQGFKKGKITPEVEKKAFKMLQDEYKALEKDGVSAYKKLAGEVEARNVEKRLFKSDGLPTLTEDIPTKLQKVIGVENKADLAKPIFEARNQIDFFPKKVNSLAQFKKEIQAGIHNDLLQKIDKMYTRKELMDLYRIKKGLKTKSDKIKTSKKFLPIMIKGSIPNFNEQNLKALLKKARETGKMPLNEDIAKGFTDKVRLLDRKARLDEIKKVIKSNVDLEKNIKKPIIKKDIPKIKSDFETGILTSLNPTGGLYVKYNPGKINKLKLGKNITTLDKTMGVSPNKEIMIYRGAPKIQKKIVPGDFITTNYELAKSYTGEGNILQMKVRAKDILDDITEPMGEEYIFRPKQTKGLKPKAK